MKIEPVVDSNFNVETGVPSTYTVTTTPNLTDNELVRGPAIQNEDIRLSWANYLGYKSSGVVGEFLSLPQIIYSEILKCYAFQC